MQLFSAEHFEQGQHPWYCTARPIHDPRTGELLGIVDVSGPALTLHPAIAALVETAVRLAEARLWRHHERRLERLRRSGEPVLAGVSGPLLSSTTTAGSRTTPASRPATGSQAPREHRALAVPGLGLCLPERLGDGWLVRPARWPGSVTACLDLHRGARPRRRRRRGVVAHHADRAARRDAACCCRAGRAGLTARR